jgi:3-phosphoglycerate kinase
LVESDRFDLARELLAEAELHHVTLVLPSDQVVAPSPQEEREAISVGPIPHTPTSRFSVEQKCPTKSAWSRNLFSKVNTILIGGAMAYTLSPCAVRGQLERSVQDHH